MQEVPHPRTKLRKKQKLPAFLQGALELMTGFEPVTYALPRRCATTCATSAYSVSVSHRLIYYTTGQKKSQVFFQKFRVNKIQDFQSVFVTNAKAARMRGGGHKKTALPPSP